MSYKASMENETWKPIVGYEGSYEASSIGRVRSLDRQAGQKIAYGRIIAPSSCGNGYTGFALCRGNAKVRIKTHRAVCLAFHGEPVGRKCVRHLNGDRSDNRAANLAWGTWSDNMADAKAHGTFAFGEKSNKTKLKDVDVRQIRQRRANGERQHYLADEFGISRSAVSQICAGKRWGHVV